MLTLQRLNSFYNPFYVMVDERDYEVEKIIFYSGSGEDISTEHGWFGDGQNEIDNIRILHTTKYRRKFKRDGIINIVPNRKPDRNKNERYALIYIPFDIMNFKKEELTKERGYITFHYPMYRSCNYPGVTVFGNNPRIEIDENQWNKLSAAMDQYHYHTRMARKTMEDIVKYDPARTVPQTEYAWINFKKERKL